MTKEHGKLTRNQAIAAKCKDCIYDPLEPGSWRMQTQNCPCTTCPLWVYRPLSRSKK